MRNYLVIFFAFLLIIGCINRQSNKIERPGEPEVRYYNSDDEEMNNAITEAVRTLDLFKEALESKNPNYSNFGLKVRFPTREGGEHLWINNITIRYGEYYGIVNNVPIETSEVAFGDTIEINQHHISDWMFINSKKLMGGYTVRIQRNQMSEAEKKKFDTENDFIVED